MLPFKMTNSRKIIQKKSKPYEFNIEVKSYEAVYKRI